MQRLTLDWTVGPGKSLGEKPAKFVSATVPGAVQLDWAKAEKWGPHYYNDNYKQYAWMEDVYWIYRAKIPAMDLKAGQRLAFVCKGIDYRFVVMVDAQIVHRQEGMFTPFEIDLTGAHRDAELKVIVYPAPKSIPAPADRNQANQSCKPAVSYSWDFHPRLIPLGIWDETYLEVRDGPFIKSAETLYTLSADLQSADITVAASFYQPATGTARWKLLDRAGKTVAEAQAPLDGAMEARFAHRLKDPELWWPNGQGEAALYTSVVEILDAGGAVRHERRSRVGFRRVKLVMAPNQWDWPPIADFPKGPSNPPITLEINNRPIFAKGSNWVAPDVFPGTITENLYRAQLDMVKSANMNILRLWGGAIINKDVFYDLCDERGIMIWQEFPLACNRYEGTPEYLKVIDQESKSIITRLRFHACIVLWCGGNELFNVWSGMTPQDLALRLLNRNCYDLDPGRPFIPTSPIMGMGHGHYVMRDPKDRGEVWPLFQNAGCTAYTEFGCGGPSPVELLKTFIPEQDLFPPKFGTAWETHHALKAWMAESHLYLTDIEYYFGEVTGLEDLVEKGQLLQGEVLRGIFEESRRQKPASAMALNWCFNEPWPCAANNSLLAWRNTPKRAYFAVAEACRPVLASARIEKMKWKEAEWFTPELWLLNDAPHALPAGRIEALLALDGKEYFLLNWDHPAVEANTNLPGPKLRFKLPHGNTKRMKLILRSATHADWNTEYTLAYEPIPRPAETAGARALNQ